MKNSMKISECLEKGTHPHFMETLLLILARISSFPGLHVKIVAVGSKNLRSVLILGLVPSPCSNVVT